MNSCNLSLDDYINKHLWKGNCTDPTLLRNQIATRPEDLGIILFAITTFTLEKYIKYPNDSSLIWNTIYYPNIWDCLTLSMPNYLIKEGIFGIDIKIFHPIIQNLTVYIHQKGLLFTDTPDAWQQINVQGDVKK